MTPSTSPAPPVDRGFWSAVADWTGPALLLVTPLVILIRHQQYSLLAPECLVLFAALVCVGLTCSALAARLGNYARVPLLASLVTLFIDLQTDIISDTATLAFVFAGTLVAALVLRAHLSTLVSLVGVTLLSSSLVLPVSDRSVHTFRLAPERQHDGRDAAHLPPPIVHIILDAMIGVAGIPVEFDRDGATVSAVEDLFLSRGFRLYGKATSISWFTRTSIGSTMNFVVGRAGTDGFPIGRKYVGSSAYFEELVRRGYQIHVYQSEHLDFCRDEDGAPVDGVRSCVTYPNADLAGIGNSAMSTAVKSKLLAGIYSRLSFAFIQLHLRYQTLLWTLRDSRIRLPKWPAPPTLTPLSAMAAFDRLTVDLAQIERGNAYLAHLLLPHFPYAFDDDCRARPDPSSWLTHASAVGKGGTAPSVSYEQYLDQVRCTMKRLAEVLDSIDRAGRFRDAQIIVHGDHGSRILRPNGADAWRANRVARTSTLFAFHEVGGRGGGVYDTLRAPINLLLPEVLKIPGHRLALDTFRPGQDFEAGKVVAPVRGSVAAGEG